MAYLGSHCIWWSQAEIFQKGWKKGKTIITLQISDLKLVIAGDSPREKFCLMRFKHFDRFTLSYNEKFHHLLDTGIPVNPQSWCHQCTNIDTRSGIIWSSCNQIVYNYTVKDTSSLLSMARFCLTKWFRFSEILTMLNRSHLKVRNF